jgi:hypothetical protein
MAGSTPSTDTPIVGPWRGSTLTPPTQEDRAVYHEVVLRIASLIELAVGDSDAVLDVDPIRRVIGESSHAIRYWKLHYFRNLDRPQDFDGDTSPDGHAWVHLDAGSMAPTLTAAVLSIAAVYAYDIDCDPIRLRTEFLKAADGR